MLSTNRMAKSIKSESFYRRVFSDEEHAFFESRKNNIETITANFCVKEAFLKAMGLGLGALPLCEIYALRQESGAPYLVLKGKAQELAKEKNLEFSVTISHDSGFAIATVIGYGV